MNLHQKLKSWVREHPYLFTLIVSTIFFLLVLSRGHCAERDYSDIAKDAAIDGLAAVTAFAGSVEQGMTGNYMTSAALAGLGVLEAEKAYNESCEAWNAYQDRRD